MRYWIAAVVGVTLVGLQASVARAADEDRKTSERILGGVVSGLFGVPQQSPEAAFTAQERDRLVSLLQSGEYVTSRQGETIDLMVFGIPLTRADHVYTARPIQPSQAAYRQSQP